MTLLQCVFKKPDRYNDITSPVHYVWHGKTLFNYPMTTIKSF